MSISNNSRAAANAFGMQNGEGSGGLSRKILIIGQQLPAFDLPEEEVDVPNADTAATLVGRGSVLHRLVIAAIRGTQGKVDISIIPQDEASAATAATGTFTVAGTATAKETWGIRLNGDEDLEAEIQTTVGQTGAEAATAIYAEAVKLLNAPVTYADDTAGVLTFTAKNKGTFGNFVSIEVIGTVPAGLTATVSAMSGGATDPDIDTALTATGNNDNNNTDLIHGYDFDGTTRGKISSYNGEGNEFVGMYQRVISRPFRSMLCENSKTATEWDTYLDDDDIKVDRTNGCLSLPGCTAHPSEIAASVVGIMARVNDEAAAQYFEGEQLSWLPVPSATERYWELGSDAGYSIRDNAVRKGLSPVIVIDGVYTLQNVQTFYHPDNVDESENGWIDQSDISINQNILQYFKDLFSSSEWTGVTFVEDRSAVGTVDPNGNVIDRTKIKDRTEVLTTLIEAAKELAAAGWLYNSAYTIEQLQANPSYVTLRSNGTGFDYQFPCWFRLKGYIKNGTGTFYVGGSIAA